MFVTTKRWKRTYKISCVMSKLLNLFFFTNNFYWRKTISILISKCKYRSLYKQLISIFFSISWMSNKIFDKKWFLNELTLILTISKTRANNSINKLINKIANKRTIFLSNSTLVIFNFRINIDCYLTIIHINIKIYLLKLLEILIFVLKRVKEYDRRFCFERLSNNFCNWFSKTRSISN